MIMSDISLKENVIKAADIEEKIVDFKIESFGSKSEGVI